MLNIAAFTFNYDQIEDRILLVGNHNNSQQRIDFWLTRKLVLRLLDAAQALLEKTVDAIAQAPMPQKEHIAQFDHDGAQLALQGQLENDQVAAQSPYLLHRLDISHADGHYRVTLFSSEDQALASSVLNYQELHQVFYILHKGAVTLDWGVANDLFVSTKESHTLQ